MLTPLLLAAALVSAPGAPASNSPLDSLLRAEAAAGFSGSVLVARGDRVVFEGAYGKAATLDAKPGEVAYWLASDSKQFTATAILRLEQSGRLQVADSIGRFLPGVPADKRGITIHQLLAHTSGLPTAYVAEGVAERDRAVRAILGLPLSFAPGEKYAYSNDGYVLLAAIVEIASGVPFDDYLRDSLFARAGLEHTGLWGSERAGTVIAPLADDRKARSQKPTIYAGGHSVANWGYRGPGGAYATPRDVHRWITALRSGRILDETRLHELLGRHVLVRADTAFQSYGGYGWGVRVEHGLDTSYGHVGDDDWLGHSSVIRFTPEGDLVVVLADSGESGAEGWAARVNREIRRLEQGGRGTGR